MEYTVPSSRISSRGTLRFSDVTSLGENNEHLGFVRDLQRKIQFDDPANIQFTSVSTAWFRYNTVLYNTIFHITLQ